MDRGIDGLLASWRPRALAIEEAVGRAMVGQARAIRLITIATFARGHVLLQGDVGVGKTTLLRAFAQVLGGRFGRIEGTVDLMPGDLLYHTYITAEGRPAVEPGPLTREGEDLSIFFFNEINRARPQVHALLLRVMAEKSVSAFNREWRFPHLQVFADRNRVEREETFEIASAARDRFMMEIAIDPPADDAARRALVFDTRFHDVDRLVGSLPEALVPVEQLGDIAEAIQQGVQASTALQDYVLRLWHATVLPQDFGIDLGDVDTASVILAGASPRGMSYLLRAARVAAWLAGRDHVVPEDVRAVFSEVISHRLCFQPVHELRRDELAPALMHGILAHVPAP
ncbi:AAA family ATPase [Caldimonas sp. KR1-144]|uniref:AAA family ATPase n=1 Tax=Caldimonas sp. KR1-144 TaxID=3400911 RepID=UPI003C090B37